MSSESWSAQGKNSADIENDIRSTRDRMSADMDAIGEKLSPEHLKQRAKQALRGAGEAVVENVQNAATDVAHETEAMGRRAAQTAKDNPVPALMIGVGLAWMLLKKRNQTNSPRWSSRWNEQGWGDQDDSGVMDSARDKAHEVSSKAREVSHTASRQVQHVAQATQRRTRHTGQRLQRFFRENSLVSGAGLLALGAIVGALLPRTRQENELMGEKRDELMRAAQGVATHAKQTFEERVDQSGQQR